MLVLHDVDTMSISSSWQLCCCRFPFLLVDRVVELEVQRPLPMLYTSISMYFRLHNDAWVAGDTTPHVRCDIISSTTLLGRNLQALRRSSGHIFGTTSANFTPACTTNSMLLGVQIRCLLHMMMCACACSLRSMPSVTRMSQPTTTSSQVTSQSGRSCQVMQPFAAVTDAS